MSLSSLTSSLIHSENFFFLLDLGVVGRWIPWPHIHIAILKGHIIYASLIEETFSTNDL